MALMEFREPNQVKWVGSRPGHNGTQWTGTNEASGNTVVVPVPGAFTTLYLCTAIIAHNSGLPASGIFWLETGGGVLVLTLASTHITAEGSFAHSTTFWPPLEVPSGYVFKVSSTAAGCLISGNIFGWYE